MVVESGVQVVAVVLVRVDGFECVSRRSEFWVYGQVVSPEATFAPPAGASVGDGVESMLSDAWRRPGVQRSCPSEEWTDVGE